MLLLQHDIFEGTDTFPVLTHLFYGETEQEALDVLKAHSAYDEFLHAALTTMNFKGIPLRTTSRWSKV